MAIQILGGTLTHHINAYICRPAFACSSQHFTNLADVQARAGTGSIQFSILVRIVQQFQRQTKRNANTRKQKQNACATSLCFQTHAAVAIWASVQTHVQNAACKQRNKHTAF